MNNALSLFHGMGCFNVACEMNGEEFDNIYTAEIDKYANIVDKANNTKNINLGDVTNWREWDLNWRDINLIVGGSPCQGFSFAGKQLAFDDPRSKLFFTFMDILNHAKKYNPDVDFMLENVKMKKGYTAAISAMMGVQPMLINAALLNAQNRVRNYWCNWDVEQPGDRGVLLKDILETEEPVVKCTKKLIPKKNQDKAGCLTAGGHSGGNHSDMDMLVKCGALRGCYIKDGKRQDGKMKTAGLTTQRLELRKDDKTNTLTTVQKDNLVVILQRPHGFNKGGTKALDGKTPTITSNSWEHNNFVIRAKSKCARAGGRNSDDRHEWDKLSKDSYRRLTCIECERLMGLPDNYTDHVSNTQRYKMCGNGWECHTVAHVLRGRNK